jgi:hypothetical protein
VKELTSNVVEEGNAPAPLHRDFNKVIGEVIALVPETHGDLKRDLEKVRTDVWFQPPESPVGWIDLRDCLISHLGGNIRIEDWMKAIARIVQGQD